MDSIDFKTKFIKNITKIYEYKIINIYNAVYKSLM